MKMSSELSIWDAECILNRVKEDPKKFDLIFFPDIAACIRSATGGERKRLRGLFLIAVKKIKPYKQH